ncbi:MAG: lipid-A-disaccharide synthase [Pyrinomonadaceae bacterium]
MSSRVLRVLIVAGEASGDLHAAKLAAALREAAPQIEFDLFGAAGPRMREVGVDAVVRSDGLSVIGLPEIGRALPMFWRAFKALKTAARERKADVAVLVDFPDFNLKLARALKRQGVRVVYYISPQLWAWRSYRRRTIRKYVDLLITILPFEKDWYARHGIENVEYVGSPLAREVFASRAREEFCRDHGLDAARPIVSLLPGSRHKEIVKILPAMLDAAELLRRRRADLQMLLPLGSEKNAADAREILRDRPAGERLQVIVGETYDALNASDAAAIASGTATLEAGIIGTPMAIVYKTTSLNYKLLRPLISVEHFGLINLIAGERIANELIQNDLTPQALADEIERLLEPDTNALVRERLRAATDKLGHGGASRRAAEAILKLAGVAAGDQPAPS